MIFIDILIIDHYYTHSFILIIDHDDLYIQDEGNQRSNFSKPPLWILCRLLLFLPMIPPAEAAGFVDHKTSTGSASPRV